MITNAWKTQSLSNNNKLAMFTTSQNSSGAFEEVGRGSEGGRVVDGNDS